MTCLYVTLCSLANPHPPKGRCSGGSFLSATFPLTLMQIWGTGPEVGMANARATQTESWSPVTFRVPRKGGDGHADQGSSTQGPKGPDSEKWVKKGQKIRP
jgi:hypothetical protein